MLSKYLYYSILIGELKSRIKVRIDISHILPLVSNDAKPAYKIKCNPNFTIERVFRNLSILHMIETIKVPLAVNIMQNSRNIRRVITKREFGELSIGHLQYRNRTLLIKLVLDLKRGIWCNKEPKLRENCVENQRLRWEDYNNKVANAELLERAYVEYVADMKLIAVEVTSILSTSEWNTLLFNDCLQCLEDATRLAVPVYSRLNHNYKKIVPTTLTTILANIGKDVTLEPTVITVLQCIINMMSVIQDDSNEPSWALRQGGFYDREDERREIVNLFLNAGMLQILPLFVDLCSNPIILGKVAEVYELILFYVWHDGLADTEWIYNFSYWLGPLQTLMFHDDECVKKAAICAYCTALRDTPDKIFGKNNRGITNIYNCEQLTFNYQQKQYKPKILFDGYMRTWIVATDYIFPHDVSSVIFSYFNIYFYDTFDIIQRLIEVFETGGTAQCSAAQGIALLAPSRTVELINDYRILPILKNYLSKGDAVRAVDDGNQLLFFKVYQIISRLHRNQQKKVWESRIIPTMILTFSNNCENSRIHSYVMIESIEKIVSRYVSKQGSSKISCIIQDFDLIKAICFFMRMMIEKRKDLDDSNIEIRYWTQQSFKALCELITSLLKIDDVKEMVVSKLKVNLGIDRLTIIKDVGCGSWEKAADSAQRVLAKFMNAC